MSRELEALRRARRTFSRSRGLYSAEFKAKMLAKFDRDIATAKRRAKQK